MGAHSYLLMILGVVAPDELIILGIVFDDLGYRTRQCISDVGKLKLLGLIRPPRYTLIKVGKVSRNAAV